MYAALAPSGTQETFWGVEVGVEGKSGCHHPARLQLDLLCKRCRVRAGTGPLKANPEAAFCGHSPAGIQAHHHSAPPRPAPPSDCSRPSLSRAVPLSLRARSPSCEEARSSRGRWYFGRAACGAGFRRGSRSDRRQPSGWMGAEPQEAALPVRIRRAPHSFPPPQPQPR